MPRLISFAIALSRCAERERSENFKMKNSCPWWDSISGPLARQTDALSIAPRGLLNVSNYSRTLSILISIYLNIDKIQHGTDRSTSSRSAVPAKNKQPQIFSLEMFI